jgi:hypothetical protein
MNATQLADFANAAGAPLTTNKTNLAVALATCGSKPMPCGGGMIATVEPASNGRAPEVVAIFGFLNVPFKHPYPSNALAKIQQLRLQNLPITDAVCREFFNEWESGTLTPTDAKARFTSETYHAEHPNDPITFLAQFCEARAGVQDIIMDLKTRGKLRVHNVTTAADGRELHRFEIPATIKAKG